MKSCAFFCTLFVCMSNDNDYFCQICAPDSFNMLCTYESYTNHCGF